jgi:hypothetical protein
MNITSKIQLIHYKGTSAVTISTLPNVSNILKIYTYNNGSPIDWSSGVPDGLQGFTTLSPNTGYIVISTNSATYPYVLHSQAVTPLTSSTISGLLQISEFQGTTIDLSTNTTFTNKVDKIYKFINNSPIDWTNGVPSFLQGFTTLVAGDVYLFDSNNVPYNLFTIATTTTAAPTTTVAPTTTATPTTTTATPNITYGVGNEESLLFFDGASTPNNREYFDQLDSTYDIIDMSVSENHLLFLTRSGELYSAGTQDYAVGSSTLDKNTPFRLVSSKTFISISTSTLYSLAVASDGTLWAWGDGANSKLGNGSTTTYSVPTQIGTATNWLKVAASYNQAYALKSNGTLWYWGATNAFNLSATTPTQYGSDTDFQDIATNQIGSHFLLVVKNNKVYSVGANGSGQLGIGTTNNATTLQYVMDVHPTNRKINCGSNYAFVITNGSLYGFGSNEFRKIKDTGLNYYTPELIATNVADVSAGRDNSLFIKDSQLYFAGATYGNLGDRFHGGTLSLRSEADLGTDYIPFRLASNTANNFNKVYIRSCTRGNMMGFATRPNANNYISGRKILYSVNTKIDLTNFKRDNAWNDSTDLTGHVFFAINNSRSKLYSADYTNSRIVVMNLLTGTQIKNISLGSGVGPVHLLLNEGLDRLYSINTLNNTVTIINTSTDTIISTTSTQPYTTPVQGVIGSNNLVYVACRTGDGAGRILILNQGGSVYGNIQANPYLLGLSSSTYNSGPYSIAYQSNVNKLYTGHNNSFLTTQLDSNGNFVSYAFSTSLPSLTYPNHNVANAKLYCHNNQYISKYPTVDISRQLEYFATTSQVRLIKIRDFTTSITVGLSSFPYPTTTGQGGNIYTEADTMAIYTPA